MTNITNTACLAVRLSALGDAILTTACSNIGAGREGFISLF
jgi:hypothetical protein